MGDLIKTISNQVLHLILSQLWDLKSTCVFFLYVQSKYPSYVNSFHVTSKLLVTCTKKLHKIEVSKRVVFGWKLLNKPSEVMYRFFII